MTTITQKTVAGARVCTIGRDGARQAGPYASIYTGKVYEAQPRKDGVLTWRLVDTFGGTRSGKSAPSAKFKAEVKAAATHEWKDVSHGQVCD